MYVRMCMYIYIYAKQNNVKKKDQEKSIVNELTIKSLALANIRAFSC